MPSSVPASDDHDPYANRRASPRVSVALPAFLQAGGQRHFVQLIDVSAGGAKLDCPAGIAIGTEVTLDCGVLGRTALVRWQHDGVLGVSFDSELGAHEVSALIERSNALAARMQTRG